MINYGIMQNQQISLTEVLDDLSIYNLDLYREMGDKAHKHGDEIEAISWYSKGLSMAREIRDTSSIELFTNLIVTSL